MRNLSPVAVLIIASIFTVAAMASIIYFYQRETTSIEDKYLNRSSSEEVDALYHSSYYGPGFDENDPSTFPESGLVTEDDYYSDNLTSGSDVLTQGVVIEESAKKVCGDEQGNPSTACNINDDLSDADASGPHWRNGIVANNGDYVKFLVHLKVTNHFAIAKTVLVGDILGDMLAYSVANPAQYSINGSGHPAIVGRPTWILEEDAPDTPVPYSIEWYQWLEEDGFRLTVPAGQTWTLNIVLWAQLTPGDSYSTKNTAYILVPLKPPVVKSAVIEKRHKTTGGEEEPFNDTEWAWQSEDTTPEGGGTLPPTEGSLPDLLKSQYTYKYVRNVSRGESQWDRYTIASPGEQIDFMIHAQLGDTSKLTQPIKISDILGIGINYQAGTSKLKLGSGEINLPDDWFGGYLLSPQELRGASSLEISFSANIQPGYWRWSTGTTNNVGRFTIPEGFVIDKICLVIVDR
ncbi:hypothetical protein A2V68_00740 [candidate division Kazan bacterium RBG_13_50_9]|uniref:Uncharacterized protein n=1 Tax=candidate division Kazan bacterium RBG_13_50_9 TaxID=1798535 RepID=A0A1F4NSM9_UNCK3|nr:MAG: hypothetical protein A2V68_00740 [candidate division Kazan bacterium RBG_13_50_9]